MERMNEMKLLIVDDEDRIRNVVKMYLRKEGYEVVEAADGSEALEVLAREDIALMILDIMMPGVDGWTVCREVRANSALPIIMLTAKEEETDRVLGLELGADDYVVKPFSPRELVARVKAVLRRSPAVGVAGETNTNSNSNSNSNFSYPGIEINPETRQVTILDRQVKLTVKEFNMLLLLARNYGRAFSRDELLQNIWGYDYYGDTRTVDTHINRLRDKLSEIPGAPNFISTVWGVGYKFEVVE